jgi:flagellar protein FliO/FliZ
MSLGEPWLALLALAAVIGLIVLTRRAATVLPALARAGGRWPGAVGGPLAIEQVLALDPRRRLLLVRCGPRRLLLLTGGPQDIVVGWPDGAPPPPDAAP